MTKPLEAYEANAFALANEIFLSEKVWFIPQRTAVELVPAPQWEAFVDCLLSYDHVHSVEREDIPAAFWITTVPHLTNLDVATIISGAAWSAGEMAK